MSGFGIASEKVPTMKSLDGVNKKNDVNDTASEAPEKNVKTESEKIDFSKVKLSLCLKNMLILKHFQSQISVQ